MTTKAIFFDLWGTILENGVYSPLKQTYNLMRPRMDFSSFVITFADSAMRQSFDTQEALFTTAMNALKVPVTQAVIDKLVGLWNTHRLLAHPYDDSFEQLEDLKKNFTLILISNSDCFTEQVIEKFELRKLFHHVLPSYETGLLKTDVESFNKGLELAGITADEAVMVGDSIITDINAAEAAGLRAFLIDRRDRREHANKIITLRELRGKLD